jgi:hypothetical protein
MGKREFDSPVSIPHAAIAAESGIRRRKFPPARPAPALTENDPWTTLCGMSDKVRLDIRAVSS